MDRSEQVDLSEEKPDVAQRLAAEGLLVDLGGTFLPSDAAVPALEQEAASRYAAAREDAEVLAAADKFEPVNSGFLEAMSAWQLVKVGDRKVPNDHTDPDYDDKVVSRIERLVGRLGDAAIDKTLHHWINDGLMGIFFFVGIIEVISIAFRPVSLSFRLYGNIFAGENVLHTMSSITPPTLGSPALRRATIASTRGLSESCRLRPRAYPSNFRQNCRRNSSLF